jgi:membrane protein
MYKTFFKTAWEIIKDTFRHFQEDSPMTYGASIAFYTIFSLPATMVLIIYIGSTFAEEQLVQGELFDKIRYLVGDSSALQLQKIMENARTSESQFLAKLIGIGTLMFSATTVFVNIQEALNHIWHVKAKPKRGLVKFLMDRVFSFAMVASLGFILLVSLVIDLLLTIFKDFLERLLSEATVYLVKLLSFSISLATVTLVFALIFKVLPDAKVKWKDVWIGALVTTGLFSIGRYLISLYLGTSNIGSTYGVAGSLVLVLIWIYYSSIILLLGAEFTKAFSNKMGRRILPKKNAVKIVRQEEARAKDKLGEKEKKK